MNKNEFLKKLEKKLLILDEIEIKDILNEYGDIIDEKVKNGKTEEEAVSEFGSIDELSKEILSAYKINPEYGNKKSNDSNEKSKEFFEKCESSIKKGADKLSKILNNVVDNFESKDRSSNAHILELIIKIVILLIVIAILKIPFIMIGNIGEAIFSIGYSSHLNVPVFIWKFILELTYFVISILLIVFVIKRYNEINIKNDSVDSSSEIKKKKHEQEKTDEIKVEPKKTNNENNETIKVSVILIRIFTVLIFVIPFSFAILGIMIAASIVLSLVIKGVPLIGLLVLLIGLSGLFISVISIILSAVFDNKKVHIFPLILNIIIIIIGGILSMETAINMNFHKNITGKNLKTNVKEYTFNITERIYIDNNNGNLKVLVDDSLEDNIIEVFVNYYDEYVDDVAVKHIDTINSSIIIENAYSDSSIGSMKKLYKLVLNDLKNNNIYDYRKLFETEVTIYVNSKTKNLLRIY